MATRYFGSKPLPNIQQQRTQTKHIPASYEYNHHDQYKQAPPKVQRHQQQTYQRYEVSVQEQQHPYQHQLHQHQQQQPTGYGFRRPNTEANMQQSLRNWFDAIDTDRSGTLTCVELGRAL
ncbi:hypothetical protein BG004_006991, partial [Podila humilis]